MNFWGLNESRFRRQLAGLMIILLGTALTCQLMVTVAAGELVVFTLWVVALGLVIWTFFAREAWWLLMPIAIGFGGVFYFGFKLYTHELMLAISFLPLLPQLATGRARYDHREKLPAPFYLLLVYLGIHMGVSCYIAKAQGDSIGSILRVYGRALWPLIFAVPFYAMGGTRLLRRALAVFFWAAFARSVLGVFGYYYPQVLAPTMRFILPGLYSEGFELRESGLWLVFLGFTLLSMSPRWIAKCFYLGIILLAGWFVILGGGRTSLAMACSIPMIWAVFQKRFVALVVFGVGLALVLTTFNVNPELVYQFPKRFQRTLSIFVIKSPYQTVHAMVEGSNTWHYELMQRGYRKWIKTPFAFLVGTRVLPYKETISYAPRSFYDKMQVAEDLGYYESGLWTVLATLGIVGMLAYLSLFWILLGPVIRSLWRHRIVDQTQGFAFLAVASALIWLGFCWVAGHFPSEQLMLAVIARAAYEDQLERERETVRLAESAADLPAAG